MSCVLVGFGSHPPATPADIQSERSAHGNSPVEFGGSAILVCGVSNLTAADFLF